MITRILVVGLGSIGKRHISIVRKYFPEVEISVLRHQDCNDDKIKNLGITHCVTSIEHAIGLEPQAAIIASPATKHLGIAIQLAKSGIHLLIEKPIAESSRGVEELIDLCLEKNIVLMTAYNLRFLPSLVKFREYVNESKVGKILTVNAKVGSYLPSWRPNTDYSKTVSAKKSLGGGVLLELSHEFDYLSWIFGKIIWVKSHVSKQSDFDIDAEDLANIILGLKSSNGSIHTATLNMDFFRHDTVRYCEVIGKKGTLTLDFISGEVRIYSPLLGEWEVLYQSLEDKNFTYIEEIKHFFLAIESNNYSPTSAKDGLKTVLAIEAVNKSSDKNSIVYV